MPVLQEAETKGKIFRPSTKIAQEIVAFTNSSSSSFRTFTDEDGSVINIFGNHTLRERLVVQPQTIHTDNDPWAFYSEADQNPANTSKVIMTFTIRDAYTGPSHLQRQEIIEATLRYHRSHQPVINYAVRETGKTNYRPGDKLEEVA